MFVWGRVRRNVWLWHKVLGMSTFGKNVCWKMRGEWKNNTFACGLAQQWKPTRENKTVKEPQSDSQFGNVVCGDHCKVSDPWNNGLQFFSRPANTLLYVLTLAAGHRVSVCVCLVQLQDNDSLFAASVDGGINRNKGQGERRVCNRVMLSKCWAAVCICGI